MSDVNVTTYECKKCGSEITVKSPGEKQLTPIYCCGSEVKKISSFKKKQTKQKDSAKKASIKKVVAKKRSSAKKKISKK